MSVRRAQLLNLARSTVYYQPQPTSDTDLALMRRIVIRSLLLGLTIDRPNQVWAMDTTYIPMWCGFVYLTVVLDWASRRVLVWRLSISLAADAAVEALEEAIARTACWRCIPGRLCPA